MMTRLFFISLFTSSILLSCHTRKDAKIDGNLINAQITDTCLRQILIEYIKAYPFENKGVYVVGIKGTRDTIKYVISIVFSKVEQDILLDSLPYLFYDTVMNRPVIFYTKVENSIKPVSCATEDDSLLNSFYYKNPVVVKSGNSYLFRNGEVYCVEYSVFGGRKIKEKVIYFNPFD